MFSFPAEDGLINGRIACYIGTQKHTFPIHDGFFLMKYLHLLRTTQHPEK